MINDLKPFAKELTTFRRQGALPQGEVKRELAKIYEANWVKRWGAAKINQGCPGCIRDMMKILSYEWENAQIEFKAVPNLESMKWGQLRKYATEKGINVKHKKKADILAELKEL